MDSHAITNWDASNGELQIVVVSYPFCMTKRFVWKHHTTNNYGQGAKFTWWNMYDGKASSEVYDQEGRDLLTALVHSHPTLGKLVDHYKIPVREEV